MDKAMFVAKTDLQIGDKVKTIFTGDMVSDVYDIRAIHSLRENSVQFEFKLTANKEISPWLQRSEIIYPI